MNAREVTAHQAGFYFGRGGAVGDVWKCVRRELRTAGERAAFRRGVKAGKAVAS